MEFAWVVDVASANLNKKIKKNLCTKNFNISAQKSSVAPSLRWLMTIWEADVRRFVCCESGSSLAPTGALKSKDEIDECDKIVINDYGFRKR